MTTYNLRHEGNKWLWGNVRGAWKLYTLGADTYTLSLTSMHFPEKIILSAVVLASDEEARRFIAQLPDDVQPDTPTMKWWERG